MKIPFYKYQGTGNDFVIIDQFEQSYLSIGDQEIIHRLCDRKFGVGADGLILLERSDTHDFKMIYFNADGKEGSLCGNGSRCAVACMHMLGRFEGTGYFEASDGPHQATVAASDYIELKMQDIQQIERGKGFYILDTGSPHYVTFVEDLSDIDIVATGRAIRYSNRFQEQGINVNFVEELEDKIEVSTYERGVEDETLSCGTGVTAAALAHALKLGDTKGPTKIKTKGGELRVRFHQDKSAFTDVWLCGPATLVFQGNIDSSN
ncbi:UNVERIFIED_CONTAM: hypothetical protein GTU68_027632 [Idotea baltica]|nr:hypothetical protein [Idotea baltica]